jgi:Flp pilus assembly pilin Flp
MTDTPTTTTPTPRRLRTGAARGAGLRRRLGDDRGSATAEYAVVILAAVAFAGVLVAMMRSGEVQDILTELVRGALSL